MTDHTHHWTTTSTAGQTMAARNPPTPPTDNPPIMEWDDQTEEIMRQPLYQRHETVFDCPDCGHAFGPCNHLGEGRSAGPWYCDRCGQGWHLTVCRGFEMDGCEWCADAIRGMKPESGE